MEHWILHHVKFHLVTVAFIHDSTIGSKEDNFRSNHEWFTKCCGTKNETKFLFGYCMNHSQLCEKHPYVQRVMNGTPPDDKENMASILLVGIANGSFKTGSSLSTGPKDRVLAANAPYSGPVVEDGPDLTPSLALPTNSIAAIFSSSSHIVRTLRDTPLKELDVPQRAAAGSYTISDNIW
ncbi:hypothetical protein CTI12_AA597030 [Artemisia annua]|uniref:Uncharacterized protein n=1 Tax=Artemisia annua TaxID=35608 RepID=A0A2U1KK27_ARTAN|nr:hypothetical protein CTI12_AA597030 [Artemisia annua]